MGGERAAEAPVPTETSSELGREDLRSGAPQNPNDPRGVPAERAPAVVDCREIFRVMEVVERDSTAIAESFGSLFSTLRLALSEVTGTSVENMQCFSDVVGQLQESALDAATKGNRYINSCLRLNEEMKGMESLAVQLKVLRKNVDALDSAVSRLVRLP